MKDMSNIFVSVIIPVFNDAAPLRTCLESLQKQTYGKELYEVIVVDNGSDEDIENVISQFSQALTTHESHPGSYAARNKGISLAKGEVIAFTDADCIPALDWIEMGVKNLLETPNCGLVAGKIEFFFKNPEQPTAIEFFDSVIFLNQKKYAHVGNFAATANLFTFAKVFKEVGLFNEELKSAGDIEWGNRVYSKGYKVIYKDDVCIKHPARSTLSQLYKKVSRVMGGQFDINREKNADFMSFVKEIAIFLKPPIKFLSWRLSDERLKGKTEKIKFILVTLFVNYANAWERIRLQLGSKSKRS